MDVASSFRHKINPPKSSNLVFKNYHSKQNYEPSSESPKNSPLKVSHLATPTKIKGPSIQHSTESSRFCRSAHGRYSQRVTSSSLRFNTLAYAIKSNDLPSLKCLLKLGLNPNETDNANVPVLLLTLEGSGKPEFLKVLLEAGADPDACHPISHRTGLHLAAKSGFQSIARQLLSAKANVNLLDCKGENSLMYAIRAEHAGMLRLFVQHCADVELKNCNNETPLFMAVERKNLEMVEVLLASSSDVWNYPNNHGVTPLLLAFKLQLWDIAQMIIDKLEDFSTIDCKERETGRTALHWAVHHKATHLVEQLLHVGADPNIEDSNSETPFLLSVKNALPDHLIETFLQYDSNVATEDRKHNTALHFAVSNSRKSTLRMLLEQGADVNGRCSRGMTPLMVAAFKNDVVSIESLLGRGAQHNTCNLNSVTPLIFAILGKSVDSDNYENNIQTVLSLIRKGADVDEHAKIFNMVKKYDVRMATELANLAEVRFYSPLEVAYLMGNSRLFEVLVQSGCRLQDFKLELLELNGSYHQHHTRFERMLEVWKQHKNQPRTLAELCRKPYIKFINDFNLLEDFEHKEILKDILEEITQPLPCQHVDENALYDSCRQKTLVKTPLKLQRSLSCKKSKTSQLKSPHYKSYTPDSKSSSMIPSLPYPSPNGPYNPFVRSKLNRCTSIKEKTATDPQGLNIFDRLYLSVRHKSEKTPKGQSKDRGGTGKETNEVRHASKELKNAFEKPKKKLILMQNFLIR